ncbi:aldo/keto reductase [Muriicola marianensis]|uniref:Oxidoreductase n=1 Tax=Muriicola marianensis TaxID=1324801 RepID=A0ABQ1QQY4_9FLAO|nr:aldo/keto reductase [Muriicola marianensis]GGD40305.1 oxidoreductase [Muriicola marianensis]
MKYRKLVRQSPSVSEIGMGTWQLGVSSDWQNLSDKEAMEMVWEALDLGVNFFDTAPNYGLGSSEERLGKALEKTDRGKVVINTKFGHTDSGVLNYDAGYIRESLEGSLRRLRTEYVDSFILHNPPHEILDGRQNDHYEILERLKDEGKIRAYGASLDTYEEMKLFMETTGGEVVEAFFNMLHQDTARAFDLAREKEVGIIVKIPLDSGWLTGKYDANSTFQGIRERWSREDIATRARLVCQLKELIGKDRDLTQTALSFCLAYDEVSTVIPGNVSIAQLRKNVASASIDLPDQLKSDLEDFYKREVKRLNLPW